MSQTPTATRSRYLVAFGGSVLYRPNPALRQRFAELAILDGSSLEFDYQVLVNERPVVTERFPTAQWGVVFAQLEYTLQGVYGDRSIDILVNGQDFDRFLVQPYYTEVYRELDARTAQLRSEATPLAQIIGPYTWIRFQPASIDFYTKLHSLLTEQILAFHQNAPAAAVASESVGADRYVLAMRAFKLKLTTYEEQQLWSAVLFGVARQQFSTETEFYNAISTSTRPDRFWPVFDPAAPKAWLMSLLRSTFSRVLNIADPDQLDYLSWLMLFRLNLAYSAEIRGAEYQTILERRARSTIILPKEQLQGVLLAFQTHPQRVPGLQYFDGVPEENMLILRLAENLLPLPSVRDSINTRFSYGAFEKAEELILPYSIDNSPLVTNAGTSQLHRSSNEFSGELSHSTPNPSVPIVGRELPRMGRFSGDYYYSIGPAAGAYAPFGGLLYPTRIELGASEVKYEALQSLAQLTQTALRLRVKPFRYRVVTETSINLNSISPFRLSASSRFSAPLPPGSSVQWTVIKEGVGLRALTPDQDLLALDLAGEEESNGLYRLEVSAPANGRIPALENEQLTFRVDFQLICVRCNSRFSTLENDHGKCVFHSHRPNPPQEGEYNFDPEKDQEIVDGLVHGAIRLNPNIYWGRAHSSQNFTEYWLCCRRMAHQSGCYVGRHSSANSGPDLSDMLHSPSRRGTEWQEDRRTSDERFQTIAQAYATSTFVDLARLEAEFNAVHGGTLRPSFKLTDQQAGSEALTQLLAKGFAGQEAVVERLFQAVDFSRSFGLWQVDRALQRAYQLNAPRPIAISEKEFDRAVSLTRIFHVLRNLPIKNARRLENARRIVLQRWLVLGYIPGQIEADRLSTQEAELFQKIAQEIVTTLDSIWSELKALRDAQVNLNNRLNEMGTLINQQTNPELYRLAFQYDTLLSEARALVLPFTYRVWRTNRDLLEQWIREQFFRTSSEAELRARLDPVSLAVRSNQPVSFGSGIFQFGSPFVYDNRRQRALELLQQTEQNLANLRTRIRTDAANLQQSIEVAAEFRLTLEAAVRITRQQIQTIRTQQVEAQEQALPGQQPEAQQLEMFRSVWQNTDPAYFEQLYRRVDTQTLVLETVVERTIRRAIVFELMRNNLADMNRLLDQILTSTLQNIPLPVLQDLLNRLKQLSFTSTVADNLAYRDTLLLDKSLEPGTNPDIRLSNFFRIVDRLLNQNGFFALPIVDQPSVQLQERWTQLSSQFNLQLLDTATVLQQIPSNPEYRSQIDNQISVQDLLQFYEQFRDEAADLSVGSPQQIRLLQQVSFGDNLSEVPYLAALQRWAVQNPLRTRWLNELRTALDLLRESPSTFLSTVISLALGPDNERELTTLFGLPAVATLLEYVQRNPAELPAVWTYLAARQLPTDQDPLVQTLKQLIRDPRTIERETTLARLSDIAWPAAPQFEAYSRLVQQLAIPSPRVILPSDSWFVRTYEAAQGPFPNPDARAFVVLANAFLNLLSKPSLSASQIQRFWQSSEMLVLQRLANDASVPLARWFEELRRVLAQIAASSGDYTFQVALLATVASLFDTTVVTGPTWHRRWQYVHWGLEFDPPLDRFRASSRPTFDSLNFAYFEIAVNSLPAQLRAQSAQTVAYALRAELERNEQRQIRVNNGTPMSARQQANSAGWLYHQLVRGDDDPMAFLVMAVLLAGSTRPIFNDWELVAGPAVFQSLNELLRTIDQELLTLDLSEIEPALQEMRAQPRIQKLGISYTRAADQQKIEMAGSPFLLRPIWPKGSAIARAWFTVLAYPFERSRVLRELRCVDHLYLLEFLVAAGNSYASGELNDRNRYLESVCNTLENEQPDALAYFVHSYALHQLQIPNSPAGGTLDPMLKRLGEQIQGESAFPTANSYALHLRDVQGVQHLVLRPNSDPFDLTAAIGQKAPNPFELWLTLSGAVNPNAERTRLLAFSDDSQPTATIIRKSKYANSRPYYNTTAELALLLREKRHDLIDLASGSVVTDLSGPQLFFEALGKAAAFVLELTPSLEIYWNQHQRNLSLLKQHIQKTQQDLYTTEVASIEQQVDARLQQASGTNTVVSRFFASIQQEQDEVLAQIDASPSSRILPNVAVRLREMLSQQFFVRRFSNILPDTEQAVLRLEAMHTRYRGNYTPYRAAVMQILISDLELSTGELAPIRNKLLTVWNVLRSIVENILVHMTTQTAGLVVAVDPANHRATLQTIDQELNAALGAVATFNFAEFERQLGIIQTQGPSIVIPFVKQSEFEPLQRRLAGGNIGGSLQAWSLQLIKRIDEILNVLSRLRSEGVDPSSPVVPDLNLPMFSRPYFTLFDNQVRADLSVLYQALYFNAWYNENKLDDNNALRDGFLQQIAPLIEQLARELLVWSERTGFWASADALLSMAVFSRDLARLTDVLSIFATLGIAATDAAVKAANLFQPPTQISAQLSAFISTYITQSGVLGALSSNISDAFKPQLQTLIRIFNDDSNWLTLAEDSLRTYLRSPSLRPSYSLLYNTAMQAGIRALPVGALFTDTNSALHILFDNWLRQALAQEVSILRLRVTLVHSSQNPSPRPLSVRSNIDLTRTAFMPLITSERLEPNSLRPNRVNSICQNRIAQWEADTGLEILSSRWPSERYDTLRSEVDLRYLSQQPNPDTGLAVEAILQQNPQFWVGLPDVMGYDPMFKGNAAIAERLESLFHFGVDTLKYAEMHQNYRRIYGDNPALWLTYQDGALPSQIPPEILQIITQSGQDPALVIGTASMSELAMRPYLGQLGGRRVLESYLRDLLTLSSAYNQLPPALSMLQIVQPRNLESATVPEQLLKRWRERVNEDNNFSQLIATRTVPSSPWGLDLYLVVDTARNTTEQWALWENRLPNPERTDRQSIVQFYPANSPDSLPLLLRGLVDAMEIDQMTGAIAELSHQPNLVNDGVKRGIYFPVEPRPVSLLNILNFLPAFPYTGYFAGNRWPIVEMLRYYLSEPPLRFLVLERSVRTKRVQQFEFYRIIFEYLSSVDPNFAHRNVAPVLAPNAALPAPLAWNNPVPLPLIGDKRPVVVNLDLSSL